MKTVNFQLGRINSKMQYIYQIINSLHGITLTEESLFVLTCDLRKQTIELGTNFIAMNRMF